jgi:hypothetical protein
MTCSQAVTKKNERKPLTVCDSTTHWFEVAHNISKGTAKLLNYIVFLSPTMNFMVKSLKNQTVTALKFSFKNCQSPELNFVEHVHTIKNMLCS